MKQSTKAHEYSQSEYEIRLDLSCVEAGKAERPQTGTMSPIRMGSEILSGKFLSSAGAQWREKVHGRRPWFSRLKLEQSWRQKKKAFPDNEESDFPDSEKS